MEEKEILQEDIKNPAEELEEEEPMDVDAAGEADRKETTGEESGEAEKSEESTEPEKGTEEKTEPSEDEKKEEKGGFFKKKNKPDKRDEAINDLTDKLKRQMAEFDNFRKRTDKEKSQMYDMGARGIIEKMLPVMDNFERGLAGLKEDEQNAFSDGMQMVYKQLSTALTEAGVTPIEAVGQEFNPDLHNAVMHVEDEEVGENIIVEEFQKGYKYHDTVVRHSMVKVAN